MENILLNIDTRFIDKSKFPNAGKFTYQLDNPLKNIGYIRLSSIELPALYYVFKNIYNNDQKYYSYTLTHKTTP